MAESEDYLDGLLNSITKVKSDIEQGDSDRTPLFSDAMRVKPDEDFLAASGLDFYLQEKSPKERIRKAYSDTDFLREFEEELLSGEADKFLEDFELELDQEEAGVSAPLSDDSLMDSIENLVSKAKKKAAVQSAADEAIALESTEQEMEQGLFDPSLAFENNSESEQTLDTTEESQATDSESGIDIETMDDSSMEKDASLESFSDGDTDTAADGSEELSPEQIAALLNGEMSLDESGNSDSLLEFGRDEHDEIDALNFPENTEGFVSEDSDMDLGDLLGADSDFSDLADMLESDANGDAIDGVGDELDAKTAEMMMASEGLTSASDEKPKGIKGFFAKLATILFGKDEDDADEAMASVASDIDMSNMSEEEIETLKNLQQSDGAETQGEPADGGKKKKEKVKKEKKEKKPKAPKPAKEKKVKEPKAPAEKEPKLPKSQLIISVIFAGSILALTLVAVNMGGYSSSITNAKKLYSACNYVDAYKEVTGLKVKKDDVEFVTKLKILAAAQSEYDIYRSSAELKRYDDALDALICGIGRCEANMKNAADYGVEPQLIAIEARFVDELEMQFGVSKEDAIDIYKTRRRQDYTKRLNAVLTSLNLSGSGD